MPEGPTVVRMPNTESPASRFHPNTVPGGSVPLSFQLTFLAWGTLRHGVEGWRYGVRSTWRCFTLEGLMITPYHNHHLFFCLLPIHFWTIRIS